MDNFMEDFGIRPKMIDYGDDSINVQYRGIDDDNKMCNNMTDREKKKKNKE